MCGRRLRVRRRRIAVAVGSASADGGRERRWQSVSASQPAARAWVQIPAWLGCIMQGGPWEHIGNLFDAAMQLSQMYFYKRSCVFLSSTMRAPHCHTCSHTAHSLLRDARSDIVSEATKLWPKCHCVGATQRFFRYRLDHGFSMQSTAKHCKALQSTHYRTALKSIANNCVLGKPSMSTL